jgi:hypothetical protein
LLTNRLLERAVDRLRRRARVQDGARLRHELEVEV